MGLPMPLHERFATGTSWVLTVGLGTWPAGTCVVVQAPPAAPMDAEMIAPCSFPDESILDVPLDILG